MEERKIVVVVEEAEEAKTALRWALTNLVRHGDTLTLLHVFSVPSKSKKKSRLLRLKGFQLALSFQSICNAFPNAKVEIVVTEGDQDGAKIATVVRQIAASMLVIGLHDRSFLYKVAMAHNDISSSFSCRVLAIKQPTLSSSSGTRTRTNTNASLSFDCSNSMDFSQIELSGLQLPELPTPRIPYRICPSPSAIIWRSRKSRRK